jgi:hypothetical protein
VTGRACIYRFASAILLLICPNDNACDEVTADVEAGETGTDKLSLLADGPDILSGALPTMIGVGDMRGRIAVGLIDGIEFVITSFTGVGVGSTEDCANAEAAIKETNNATQKNFVFIDRYSEIYYLKGCRCAAGGFTHVAKDSLNNKKVVKLKAFIYTNHKD